MIARCYRESTPSFKYYGAKGICVVDKWRGRGGFDAFLEDMGLRPADRTLDRKLNDQDYSPENCQWSTKAEQAANRSIVTLYDLDGENLPLYTWAKRYGMSTETVRDRVLRFGWPLHDALTIPSTTNGWGGNRAVERHGATTRQDMEVAA